MSDDDAVIGSSSELRDANVMMLRGGFELCGRLGYICV